MIVVLVHHRLFTQVGRHALAGRGWGEGLTFHQTFPKRKLTKEKKDVKRIFTLLIFSSPPSLLGIRRRCCCPLIIIARFPVAYPHRPSRLSLATPTAWWRSALRSSAEVREERRVDDSSKTSDHEGKGELGHGCLHLCSIRDRERKRL